MNEHLCGVVIKANSTEEALLQVNSAPLLIDKILVSDTINCISRKSVDADFLIGATFILSVVFILLGYGLKNLNDLYYKNK